MTEVDIRATGGTLGHLRHCRIDGLFGRRTVDFETAAEGPTLLYGTNGSGKSTILRLIDDIAHARPFSVLQRKFTQAEFRFEAGDRLTVSREPESLRVSLNSTTWSATTDELRKAQRRVVMRERRLAEAGRRIPPQASLFALEELDEGGFLTTLPDLFPVFFIEDQRLILQRHDRKRGASGASIAWPEHPDNEWAVQRFQADLSRDIQAALSGYASHSQELDRRFPVKIAAAVETRGEGSTKREGKEDEEEEEEEVRELRALLDRVRDERAALQGVGLLGREEGPEHFDSTRLEAESVRPVIRAFAEDTLAKFEILRDIRVRMELFSTFLNQHYQEKDVITSREDGFRIVLDSGDELRPWQLSSGEQQVLALAYQVLFGSDPGTLILIDEPELSLHVLWQSTLIEDLVTMGEARDVRFILATHSPTLIGDREELMRPLDAIGANGHGQIAGRPVRDLDAAEGAEDDEDEDEESLELEIEGSGDGDGY